MSNPPGGRSESFKLFGVWTPVDLLLIALGSAACFALVIWLESFHAWWGQALGTYVVLLVLVGGGIGAYGGWALDDVDDAKAERRVTAWLVALAFGLPLLVVLGRQALGVPFDAAPGRWPPAADNVARTCLSSIPAVLAAGLLWLIVRRWPGSWRTWMVGGLFVGSLILLAAWPWFSAAFPVYLRGILLAALLFAGCALAIPMRAKRTDPTLGK